MRRERVRMGSRPEDKVGPVSVGMNGRSAYMATLCDCKHQVICIVCDLTMGIGLYLMVQDSSGAKLNVWDGESMGYPSLGGAFRAYRSLGTGA
jgi:hypothetical protein